MAKRVIIVTLPLTGRPKPSSSVSAPPFRATADNDDVGSTTTTTTTITATEFSSFGGDGSSTNGDSEPDGDFLPRRFVDPSTMAAAGPVRKRQRLNHLSQQEKLNRRKVKNRIAAHLARERRKRFQIDLERRYKRLRFENDGLKSRNMQIKRDIDRLSIENETLKKLTVDRATAAATASAWSVAEVSSTGDEGSGGAIGSAESVDEPRQKDRASLLAGLTLGWMLSLIGASTRDFSPYSENSSPGTGGRRSPIFDANWSRILTDKLRSIPLKEEAKRQLIRKLLRFIELKMDDNSGSSIRHFL